jgi:hypothetical protein
MQKDSWTQIENNDKLALNGGKCFTFNNVTEMNLPECSPRRSNIN